MKTTFISIILLILSGTLWGQNAIEKHFSAYQSHEQATKVHVTGKAFELAAYLEIETEDPDLQEFQRFIKTVESLDLIVTDELADAKSHYKRALQKVNRSYEELMYISEDEGEMTFFVEEQNGVVQELVMVGTGPSELVLISLTGQMDLEQLSKMSRYLVANEEAQLRQLYDSQIHEVKVYPNPAATGEALQIEVPVVPERGTVTVYDLNGTRVAQYTMNANTQKLSTQGWSSGSYVLEFQFDQVRIRKKVMIR